MTDTAPPPSAAAQPPQSTEKEIMDPTDRPGYIRELTEDMIEPATRSLFENYCQLPPDQVIPHINQFRDLALKVHPYTCLARFTFLELGLKTSPAYPRILSAVQSGATFLDLGCCLAQDIRNLVHDGAPSQNTYGSDLHQAFMDIGYDLFLDRETLRTTFIAADVTDDSEASGLRVLDGKVDIIHAAYFFHLFEVAPLRKAATRIVKLFKDKKGCLLVGKQLGNIGNPEAGIPGEKAWQNPETFQKLWESVGEETGTRWKVEAWMGKEDLWARAEKQGLKVPFIKPGSRVLHFVVEKVE